MKKALRWIIGVLVSLLLVLLLVWICRNPIVRVLTERGIRQETGLETSIGRMQLDWSAARLTIQHLQIHNLPEFGGGLLLEAPRIQMVLDRPAANLGRLHFKELQVHLAQLHLVRNAAGQLNLPPRAQARTDANAPRDSGAPAKPAKSKRGYEFGGIDRLVLSVGQLTYSDLKHPAHNATLDCGIQNEQVAGLHTKADVNRWLASLLVRIALQEYLKNPAKSRSRLLELLVSALKSK